MGSANPTSSESGGCSRHVPDRRGQVMAVKLETPPAFVTDVNDSDMDADLQKVKVLITSYSNLPRRLFANLQQACAISLAARLSSLSGWTLLHQAWYVMPIGYEKWGPRVREHDVERLGHSIVEITWGSRSTSSGLHSNLYRYPAIPVNCTVQY